VRASLQKRKLIKSLTKQEEQKLEKTLVWEANRVALKVMTDLSQFERELSVRGLDASPTEEEWDKREADGCSTLKDEHVVQIIRSHKVSRHTLTYAHVHIQTQSHTYLIANIHARRSQHRV
jgi:hypothetical protein